MQNAAVEETGRYRNIEDEKYVHDHNTYEYAEDVWTKRLCIAIKSHYASFDVSYTADARGTASNSVVLQKMSGGMSLEMFFVPWIPRHHDPMCPYWRGARCIYWNKVTWQTAIAIEFYDTRRCWAVNSL